MTHQTTKALLKITFFLFCTILMVNPIFAQSQQTIVSGDNVIHYKTFGSGVPLLIINGGPGMHSEGFVPLAKIFGKSNTAIIYDQRGTGKSKMATINTSTITMDLMIEDMEMLRKELNLDQWVILGHSFGGMLAAYYAAKYPERTKGLILSSSGGLDLEFLATLNIRSRLSSQERDSLNHWSAIIASGDTSYFAQLQRGKYLAPAYLQDKSFVDAIAHRLTQGNRRINGLVWQNLNAINFDCKAALKDFPNPVLIIQGEQDIIHKSVAENTDAVFKHSDLVFIPQCAHYGWLEQPDIYFGKINDYLALLKK